MKYDLVHILKQSPDVESFQEQIESLNGLFDFSSDAMAALGEAYFERYPDSHHNRSMDEVHFGYHMTRSCIIEKIVFDFSIEYKTLLRKLFHSAEHAGDIISLLCKNRPKDAVIADYKKIESRLENIKRVIDEIPRSMIKERYIGGISYMYNILYLYNMTIQKL